MCGIAGILRADTRQAVEPDLVREMIRRIRHRGPDDMGYLLTPGAGVGHARLAILDPLHATQPMRSSDGRYALAYNGEIYNHLDLRPRLISRGHVFRTGSDTETLLCWLAEFGVGGLADLNGMFAFIFWDEQEKAALLARDRLGIKPLYWALANEDLVFGSEIKALLPALPSARQDDHALFDFLTFQNNVSNRTFFGGVERVPAGCWMRFEAGRLSHGRYWSLEFQEQSGVSAALWAERYAQTLEQAVHRHMLADVEVGAYLSGGLDSAQVLVGASAQRGGGMHAFTGAFADAKYYDEREPARSTARLAKAKMHEVLITAEDYREHLGRVIYMLDEPTLGTGALPQYMVAKLAARHVKVALTGHGGDEMFAGYQVNRVALFRDLLPGRPLAALRLLSRIQPDEISRFAYYLLYPLLYPEVGYGHFVMTPKRKRPGFFSTDFLAANARHEPLESLRALFGPSGESAGQRLTRVYLQAYLPTLFSQEDRMSMAHGVEGRTPLCDNALLDLSVQIPLEDKLAGGELKAVPRRAMRGVLPEVLFSQPKRGFPTPFARWYRKEPLRSFIQDLLSDTATRTRGVFQAATLLRLFQDNLASRTDTLYDYARANVIWSACAVELWFRTFMDREGAEPLVL